MDEDKASWILEFVLRQPLEDWLVKEILFRLPTPSFRDPHLKKALFLRRLASDLSTGRFCEDTLQSLELLEELDRSLGATSPYEALKRAYCAVAAELTASPLRAGGPAGAGFMEVVDRIWNRRVADLERSEARGLVGEELQEWKKVAEVVVVDSVSRGRILQRDTSREAADALAEYLSVAFKGMGPPLLELMASVLGGESNADGGQAADENAGVNAVQGPSGISAERVKSVEVAGKSLPQEADEPRERSSPTKDDTESVLPTAATDAEAIPPIQREENTKTSRIARRSDTSDNGRTSGLQLLPTMEVDIVKEALKSSCEELQMVVRDPLTEALLRAVEIHIRMEETSANPNASGRDNLADSDAAGPCIDSDAQAAAAKGMTDKNQRGGVSAKVPRPSLMEPNPTARTYEWDEDSAESLSEKSAYSPKRIRLPSPRIQRVSPLKVQKGTKFVRRRKIKRWTPEEENALREAVQKYGTGRWKFILQCYPEIFEDRTEVDLKDKWRNMSSNGISAGAGCQVLPCAGCPLCIKTPCDCFLHKSNLDGCIFDVPVGQSV
ncbi:unnamed protein product [Spirodela intermedia]|uniref:Uncharacterized protein n=1 Tax=Spirodela intermedia TaxID=51605 RepID=A0A7I8L4Q7_SPIIN|nr:unnamed protein product [Spirodela intermedia]